MRPANHARSLAGYSYQKHGKLREHQAHGPMPLRDMLVGRKGIPLDGLWHRLTPCPERGSDRYRLRPQLRVLTEPFGLDGAVDEGRRVGGRRQGPRVQRGDTL